MQIATAIRWKLVWVAGMSIGVGGFQPEVAAQFQMSGIELMSHVPLASMGAGNSTGSDIWGWTDSQTGREYALFGHSDGTAFVDITDPSAPSYLGQLPTATDSSIWRDIKVYQDHAFVVSDANGPHGMQVFDLTRLRNVTTPQNFSADTTWGRFGFRSAHNIAINEDSGYAYLVGTTDASGGMVFVDISNPTSPQEVGTFAADGYTHDAQIVNYSGPDSVYLGREIAFNSNEDTLTIVDVTNKSNPLMLGRQEYADSAYAHQGWLTEDHKYFLMTDEGDEFSSSTRLPRTHVWDVQDLNSPQYVGFSEGTVQSVDHNLYVHDGLVYAADYSSGLRVFEMTDLDSADLTEIAWIDTSPDHAGVGFDGAWSVFPYFESGSIIVSDQENGLFVVRLESQLPDPDFNDDNVLNCMDVDALTAVIAAESDDVEFDLNGDGAVNTADLDDWLSQAGAENLPDGRAYVLGDANLNGVVDGQDFLDWNQSKFTETAAFCQGDFNADGITDGQDFLIWNQSWNSASTPSSVPEPSQLAWLVALLVSGMKWIRQ